MLKKTETEETVSSLFCDIFIIGSISIGGGGAELPGPPSGYVYATQYKLIPDNKTINT